MNILTKYNFKNKDEYFTLGQWVSPVLELEAWLDWSKTPEAKAIGVQSTDPAIVLNGHYFMMKDGVYTRLVRQIGEEFNSGKLDLTTKILDLAEKLSNKCVEMSKEVDPSPTFEDFLKAFDLMSRLRFPWMSCFPIGDAGETFVKNYAVKHNLSIAEASELIPQLSNSVNDDQQELARFRAKIEKEGLTSDLATEIDVYQKKTEYIGTHHFWGEDRTKERLIEAINNAGDESELKKSETSEIEGFNIIARTTKWRLECAQSSAVLAYAFKPFMINLARENGITYDELIFLTTSEIKELIEKKKKPKPPIGERGEKVGVLKLDGKISIIVGEDLEDLERYFGLLGDYGPVTEFKGMIGNKGFVRGKVAILLKPTDQAKLQPGMILVAPETTPDFIPSMGKAAAFVTDQGGITSHAAIVAREMKKPCITATKIATKVLKDGDMVEVDANMGVVRIIQ